jgi:ribonuclease-3
VIREPALLGEKLQLTFQDPKLFIMALTHRSAGNNNNERLEFLGDAVLGFVIAQKLFEKFPGASEGVLSRLRANLVNQDSLAEVAREHDIGSYLILGSGELKSGGYRRDSILSDALEAIIGSITIDQGIDVCREWVLKLFYDKIERLSLDDWQKDPKTRLQEFLQSRKLNLPEYRLLMMTGAAHAQSFQIECRTTLISEPSVGIGSSRKKAEQTAAENMLKQLDF